MSTKKVNLPRTTLTILPGQTTVENTAQRVLMVGQMLSGTATSGELVSQIQNDNSWDASFGENSMMAAMVRGFREDNAVVRLDAIPLADNGTAFAAGVVAFSGTATADGSFVITIGSGVNHQYTIPVSSGDSATALGALLVTAITADTKAPVGGVNTTGSVAVTAVNAGTEGNGIALDYSGTAAGITVTLTAMASGATDPSVTGVFDVIEGERYQTVVVPAYAAAEVLSMLDARFNVTNDILDGVGVYVLSDTLANADSTLTALNSPSIVGLVNESVANTTIKGGVLLELPVVQASKFAAARSLRLQDGANIAAIVIAPGGALDNFGGPALATLPYFNTPYPNLSLIGTGLGFTDTETIQINTAGGSVFGNNSGKTSIISGEVVTTYKTDSASNPDTSFKYLNYVDTMSGIREYMVNNLRADNAQTRLGAAVGGRAIVGPDDIRGQIMGYYRTLSGSDFVLTQAGDAAEEFFGDNLTVTVDQSAGQVTVTCIVPIVTQLREIIGTVQISFATNF